MISEHQRTDEEIFAAALACGSDAEQEQAVAMACVKDPRQRERVLGLLAAHRKLANAATTFVLDKPDEVCNELLNEESDPLEEHVGPYRVMQLLGEGGMGLVYQAEQLTPIRRRVALKLLKPGMDSQKVLARFELERQALAGMDHPGITQILDAGLAASGRPYFVMELVKGVAITDYCRKHQLQPVDRIRLMVHVCSAIQHAHQRGIIHRDIKPSNILVAQGDSGPVPKIIDFGIAKLINDSMNQRDHFTLHGEMVGTPEYMSPEQALPTAEGVDTRTDVYSLGVLLYELLTGETPLAGVQSGLGLSRLRQLLRESRIELPSQRVLRLRAAGRKAADSSLADDGRAEGFLRGDVDCVVMKALALDPNDRYQSVSDLKRDLERFLAGLPVEAAPPRIFYHFSKFIRRHRVIAAVAVLACLAVLAASAIAIRFGLVANSRLQDVLSMKSELEVERDRAIAAERKARLLAQSYLAPAVMDRSIQRFIVEHWDLLTEVNPRLKSLSAAGDRHFWQPEVQATIFDSNLLIPDQRLVLMDESKSLVRILSDISKKDVGHLLANAPLPYMTGEAVPVESVAQEHEGESGSPAAQPVPDLAAQPVEATYILGQGGTHRFPVAARKAYLAIFCEELRAIDPQLPVIADAEDSIGLCLMDMKRPDLAMARFRESTGIRENYPELKAQSLQTLLFMAECELQSGRSSEARNTIAAVLAEVAASREVLDAGAVAHLEEIAGKLQAGKSGSQGN